MRSYNTSRCRTTEEVVRVGIKVRSPVSSTSERILSIFCFRKGNVLLKKCSSVTSYMTLVIINKNVNFIKSGVSSSSVVRSTRSFYNVVPLDVWTSQYNLLLIKPVFWCGEGSGSASTRSTIVERQKSRSIKLVETTCLIVNLSFCTRSRNVRENFNFNLIRRRRTTITRNTSDDALEVTVKCYGCSICFRKSSINSLSNTITNCQSSSIGYNTRDNLVCSTIKNSNLKIIRPRTRVLSSKGYISDGVVLITKLTVVLGALDFNAVSSANISISKAIVICSDDTHISAISKVRRCYHPVLVVLTAIVRLSESL